MSSTQVDCHKVKTACAKYVEHHILSAAKEREEVVEARMNESRWFGKWTREKAIKSLNEDTWNWYWGHIRASHVQYEAEKRVKGMLAMCEVSMYSWVTLSDEDCRLVNRFHKV